MQRFQAGILIVAGLFLAILVSGCEESAPVTAPKPSSISPNDSGVRDRAPNPIDQREPLIPSSADVFVAEYAPGSDPAEIATRNGWILERVLTGNTAVFSAVLDTTVLDADLDIVNYEQNQAAGLAFGQELTLGFYEGRTFGSGHLLESSLVNEFGYDYDWAETTGTGVLVAVIDTGADFQHPMLGRRCVVPEGADWLGWEEDPNGQDDDGDGRIDEAFGHGTFICGLILQVAPGATIIPMRALNSDGVGSLADILSAMDSILSGGQSVDVLNLSLSLSSYSQLFEDRLEQLERMGVTVVSAAGNAGGSTAYPASSPRTIGVAALASPHELATFSNRGSNCELAAPGAGLVSAYPGDGVGFGEGTSFAAPIVAGLIAAQVERGESVACLLESAEPLWPLTFGEVVPARCSDRWSDEIGPHKAPQVHGN